MDSIWKRLSGDDKKDLQIAKSGENFYSLLKIDGEVIMSIISLPTTYGGGYNVGVGVTLADASGNVQVGKNKNIDFGKPIILFKENNRAGLKLIDVLPENEAKIVAGLRGGSRKK
jgi:hypothetical protein